VDQPWYRNLFHRRPTPQIESRETKADHGDPDAQFSLGQGLDQGRGNAAEEGQAVAWYRRAASQNHASAQFNLGMMLAAGRGGIRDDVEARQWILRAAQQGHAAAQHNLGARCRRAGFKGCPGDVTEAIIEAYKWFGLAAAQGHNGSAGELENLAVRMTARQVLEGDQRIARFLADSPTPVGAEEARRQPLEREWQVSATRQTPSH